MFLWILLVKPASTFCAAFPLQLVKRRKRVQKCQMSKTQTLLQKYRIVIDMSKESNTRKHGRSASGSVLRYLSECIGSSVREVTIRPCSERLHSMEHFRILTRGMTFERLKFAVCTLTDAIV